MDSTHIPMTMVNSYQQRLRCTFVPNSLAQVLMRPNQPFCTLSRGSDEVTLIILQQECRVRDAVSLMQFRGLPGMTSNQISRILLSSEWSSLVRLRFRLKRKRTVYLGAVRS